MNAPEFNRKLQTGSIHNPDGESGRGRALWIALALIVVAGVIWWAVRPSTKTADDAGFGAGGPVPVGVGRAAAGDVAVTLNALGAVTPLATVTVKPQVTGILNKIDFQEGQMVKAGDVLAEIDPRPFQAALDQAKGTLAHDEAQLENAKVDLGRYQNLQKQNAISQQTLATQEALVRTDAGTVVSDKAAVETAAINLGWTKITSPVAGRVGIRQVDIGNLVLAGGTTTIVVVTQLQPISALFTLPEDDIDSVMTHFSGNAKLAADAYDRAQTTKLASGTLNAVDNEVDPTTGTVKLRAMFDNADLRLFPQEFVNVRLLVNTLQNQTTLPVAAIQRGTDGSFVYVVQGDIKACSGAHITKPCGTAVRYVKLGPQDGDRVAVLSGVEPGDVAVTDGADRLREGSKVTIPNPIKYVPGRHPHNHGAGGHHRHRSGGDGSGG